MPPRSAEPSRNMKFAEGTDTYPGAYRGLQGVLAGSGTRRWAPFGVRYENGAQVQGFYCHHYQLPAEHYHVSREDMKRCKV